MQYSKLYLLLDYIENPNDGLDAVPEGIFITRKQFYVCRLLMGFPVPLTCISYFCFGITMCSREMTGSIKRNLFTSWFLISCDLS